MMQTHDASEETGMDVRRGERTPADAVYSIVEEAMCIGCGICQSIAGTDLLNLETSASGYLHPVITGEMSEETAARIVDVCPSRRLSTLPPELVTPETLHDPIWGPYRQLVHGWANDPEERFEGATGGVLTALAAYLLENAEVDFVLHARASVSEPTFGERHVSLTRADVIAGGGSRYGPTAILFDVDELLGRGRPFAVIGKPCDISALRNLARHDERVDRLVKYWLTLVCGGFMPTEGTHAFLDEMGVDPSEVSAFRYRGLGFPGPTRVETVDGRVVEKTYYDFWGPDYHRWTLPHRCKVCPDSIGEGADIVAADPWPGGGPDLSDDSDPGTNVIIVRTAAGRELLERAVEDGALALGTPATIEDLNDYQPHQVARKQTVWPRLQGLQDTGRTIPEMSGLRVEALAAGLDPLTFEQQRQGARQRVLDGKASESRPRPRPGTPAR